MITLTLIFSLSRKNEFQADISYLKLQRKVNNISDAMEV